MVSNWGSNGAMMMLQQLVAEAKAGQAPSVKEFL